MKKVFVILGPTSSGKTSLALKLAKKMNGEIISADSRQIYKTMDIGTGKLPINANVKIVRDVDKWIIDGINVWGYDLVTPDAFFSAYDFAKFALPKISRGNPENKTMFVVGGTGFYIDILTGRVKPSNVMPDLELRATLETLSTEELQKKLESLNPQEYTKIDQKNPVRLLRALEKNLNKSVNTVELPYLNDVEFVFIGLTASREILYARADLWVENIWQTGLISETESLLQLGYKDSPKMSGLVYKSAVAFINKELSEQQAKERIKFDIHAYIRRQQTYFKKMPNVNWFDISTDDFSDLIYNFING